MVNAGTSPPVKQRPRIAFRPPCRYPSPVSHPPSPGVVARARRSLSLLRGVDEIRDPSAALSALLERLGSLDAASTSDADQLARIEWFESIARWLFADSAPGAFAARLDRLVTEMGADPARKNLPRFRDALLRLLTATSGLRLFADTGVSSEFGVAGELLERIIRRFLPAPPQPANLAEILQRLVTSAPGARRVAELAPADFRALVTLLAPADDAGGWAHVRRDMVDAVTVLAANVASIGVSADVVARLPGESTRDLPFLALVRDAEILVACLLQESDETAAQARRVLATTERCRGAVGQVVARLETRGVSLHLVYRLEQLSALLDRMESIVRILASRDAGRSRVLAPFVGALVQGVLQERSVRSVIGGAARQLSRKVVERTGEAGKQYITHTRAAWWTMLRAAAGGGALTVGTTLLKFAITAAHFAPFFYGLALSVNYAGSFLLLQWAGFKLATKQPAMFAAAIADSLLDVRKRLDPRRFVTEFAHVTRSQAATVAGNLGAAVPVALVVDAAWRLLAGHPFLDPESAAATVASLDPLGSGTIFFAAVTGVILMVSSLAGGWLENFAVYRRLPEAIARHRALTRVIGPVRAAAWADRFMHNIAGIGTSVALGVLLGMTPQIGGFFGVPLDVRHVTLSTAQLAFGLSALGPESLLTAAGGMALLGILVIGVLNFGVSFALAMLLAIRAREVSVPDAARLMGLTWREFARRPLAFLLPLRIEPAATEAAVDDATKNLAEHMARSSPEHEGREEG